jgi:hypothetical protein
MSEEEVYKPKVGLGGHMETPIRPEQEGRKMSGDEATGGPTHTPSELEKMQWQQRKEMHVDLFTPDELKRLLAEKEAREQQQKKETIETQKAVQQREKQYYDDLQKSCLDGDPTERFARALIRMSLKGVFGLNPMQDPRDKARIIAELLRFHGVQIRDSKEKPKREDFERTIYFVDDPYVKKGDVVLIKRAMFPPGSDLVWTKTE